MKRLVFSALALLASAGLAHADPFASMYGNTVTITAPDGAKSVAYVNQDMTWEQHLPSNAVLKGSYAWKDAQTVCFTQTDPAPKAGDPPVCSGGQADHKVGDTWTLTGNDGKTSTLTLTAGR